VVWRRRGESEGDGKGTEAELSRVGAFGRCRPGHGCRRGRRAWGAAGAGWVWWAGARGRAAAGRGAELSSAVAFGPVPPARAGSAATAAGAGRGRRVVWGARRLSRIVAFGRCRRCGIAGRGGDGAGSYRLPALVPSVQEKAAATEYQRGMSPIGSSSS
jgi:hypothetical protein